jgi:predicted AlkP superfamily phosphohydrolase/phosphomutase
MTQTLLIGLDGATFDVLEPLWENGTMPFLGEFARHGVRAQLRTVVPPLTPCAWTSLVTGRSPGYHGIFDFVRVTRNADYLQYQMATSTDVRSETLWSIASRQERQVASLNFPVMFPPRPIAGYSIPGFVPWRHLRRAVYPPQLYDILTSIPGFDPKELVFDIQQERRAIQVLDKEQYEEWISFHIRREERWLEVVKYLIANTQCDLLAVLFDGVDKLQHICWRFIDPKYLAADRAPWERRVHELCMSYFRRLDEILQTIVRLVGADARVFMTSDHGFGPTVEIFYINTWLSQEGYLSWATGVPYDNEGKVMFDDTRSPGRLFDWSKTRACSLSSGSNGVYIKTASEPSQRGVKPEDYVAFREELKQKLLAFRDPETGEPVVKRALTCEEAFPGPQMQRAPDLTLDLRDGGFVSILRSEQPLKRREVVAGTHRYEGIFLAGGSGIRQQINTHPLSIIDVAPLLLYSMRLPIPSDLEGTFRTDIFEETLLQATPALVGHPTVSPGDGQIKQPATVLPELTSDAQIMAQLKALGYLE